MKMEAIKLLIFQLMPFFLHLASALKTPFPDHIIIVGAGMSGISAAKKLTEEEFYNFTILEATDRIGGRIRTIEFGGQTIDIGASWYHANGGSQKNPFYDVVRKRKIDNYISDFSNVSANTYLQQGGLYSKDEVEAAINLAKQIEQHGEIYSDALGSSDDMTLLALKRLLKCEPRTPLERMIDLYFFDRKQAQSSHLASLKHTLPRMEFEYYGEAEHLVSDPRGFEDILRGFSEYALQYNNDAIDDPRIIFNQVVSEIDYSTNGVTVRTQDGTEYQGRSVILAVSLGVLQSDDIKFKPELPEWKKRAIAEFSIGLYTKVAFKFPRTFWPTGPGTEFFFYVHNERLGYYAIWQNLETYYPGSNILMLTVLGEESVRIELQSDEETKQEAMEVLREMFGNEIPEASDILVGRWRTDSLFKGSYSYWPIGYSQEKFDQLTTSLGNSVYFGGDYADKGLYGYATGAYYGGANAARGIINCIKNGRCKRSAELLEYTPADELPSEKVAY